MGYNTKQAELAILALKRITEAEALLEEARFEITKESILTAPELVNNARFKCLVAEGELMKIIREGK